MKSTGRVKRRIKIVRLVVGTLLAILTLFFILHSYSGLSYAIELSGDESGITVDQAELFNISNLYPGQPPEEARKSLKISNTGRAEFECAISTKLTKGDSRLFDILRLHIKDERGNPVYSGSLKDIAGLSLGTVRPRASKLYQLSLELPAEVDNSYQALSTSFEFEVAALGGSGGQHNHNNNNNKNENNNNNSGNVNETPPNPIPEFTRLAGQTRTATAVQISQEGWPDGAPAVALSRDDDFPDALAGAPLALKVNAPILLTNSAVLSPETEQEIARLQAKTVYILGGTFVVSQEIEDGLLRKGLSVVRIGGFDRFETAALIAKYLNNQGSKGRAVVSYGYNFPDTLAILPWAAANSVPILLTERDHLPKVTQDVLRELEITQTIVVGGGNVISDNVADKLPGMVRYAGGNRFQTNISIIENLSGESKKLCLATERDYPDALVGAVLAAKRQSFILLVDEGLSEPKIEEFLIKNKEEISFPYVFGGSGAVSEETLNRIRLMVE